MRHAENSLNQTKNTRRNEVCKDDFNAQGQTTSDKKASEDEEKKSHLVEARRQVGRIAAATTAVCLSIAAVQQLGILRG